MLRAAELFFREQRMTVHDGSLIAADEETIAGIGETPVSPLVSMLGLPAAAEIDILVEDNAHAYWERSDRFDMALDLTAGRRGLGALGETISRWISHTLAVEVTCSAERGVGPRRNLTGAFQSGVYADPAGNPGGIWRPAAATASITPRSCSLRCVGDLAMLTIRPAPSRTAQSVKVPPMSMPM